MGSYYHQGAQLTGQSDTRPRTSHCFNFGAHLTSEIRARAHLTTTYTHGTAMTQNELFPQPKANPYEIQYLRLGMKTTHAAQ